jgi:hypothetical protein
MVSSVCVCVCVCVYVCVCVCVHTIYTLSLYVFVLRLEAKLHVSIPQWFVKWNVVLKYNPLKTGINLTAFQDAAHTAQ